MSDTQQPALVSFVGAGPGAPDLITIRGRDRIARANVVLYADSLVQEAVAAYAPADATVYGSATLTLEQQMDLILSAVRAGRRVARVQSGDPSIYGAMQEQMAVLEREDVAYEIIPGVSSAFAAAAALHAELTVPDVTQTVIFTRMAGRTSMPEGEALRDLAHHGASLVIFLSIPMIEHVVQELLAGGYGPDTPAAVIYRVTWDDELILRGTLVDIASQAKAAKLQLQTLIMVGPALDQTLRARGLAHRSNLYSPTFSQRHRQSVTDRGHNS